MVEGVADLAWAAALVLSFALLLERGFRSTLAMARAHGAATACGLAAAALLAGGGRSSLPLCAAAIVTASMAALAGAPLGRLEARVGRGAAGAGAGAGAGRGHGAIASAAWIVGGLALTAIAGAFLAGSRDARLVMGLSVALIGLLLGVRPGGHALVLARMMVAGDGLELLSASLAHASPALPVAGALIVPGLLLAAQATLGRAGGIGEAGS